jgi:hypothetical protein
MALDIRAQFIKVVPQGYIGILRAFRWSFTDAPLISPTLYTARILVNGVVQPGFDELQRLGSNSWEWQKCYILADAGQTIMLELIPTGTIDPGNDVVGQLFGNLLLAKGLPLQYEPGSR